MEAARSVGKDGTITYTYTRSYLDAASGETWTSVNSASYTPVKVKQTNRTKQSRIKYDRFNYNNNV
jgi:hypothetical protein